MRWPNIKKKKNKLFYIFIEVVSTTLNWITATRDSWTKIKHWLLKHRAQKQWHELFITKWGISKIRSGKGDIAETKTESIWDKKLCTAEYNQAPQPQAGRGEGKWQKQPCQLPGRERARREGRGSGHQSSGTAQQSPGLTPASPPVLLRNRM